jgi:hypothetical protein
MLFSLLHLVSIIHLNHILCISPGFLRFTEVQYFITYIFDLHIVSPFLEYYPYFTYKEDEIISHEVYRLIPSLAMRGQLV